MKITLILFCSIEIILSKFSVTAIGSTSQKNGTVLRTCLTFVKPNPNENWKYLCENGNIIKEKLREAKDKLVMIEFMTDRKAVCYDMKSFVDDLAIKYTDLIILRVDVYKCFEGNGNPDKFSECYKHYDYISAPGYLFRKSNKDVYKIVGAQKDTAEQLKPKILEYLQNAFKTPETPNSVDVKPIHESPPTITAKEPSACHDGICPIQGSPLSLSSSVKQNEEKKDKTIQLSGDDENEELLKELNKYFPGLNMNSMIVKPTHGPLPLSTAKSVASLTPSPSQKNGPSPGLSPSPSFSSVGQNLNTGIEPYEVYSIDELKQKITEAGDKLVIIEFYDRYCPACVKMHPFFEEVVSQNPDIVALKMKVEDDDVIKLLKEDYALTGKPTFVFKKFGKEVGRVSGTKRFEFNTLLSNLKQNKPPNADIGNPTTITSKSVASLTPSPSQKNGPSPGLSPSPSFSSVEDSRLIDGSIDDTF